MAQKVLSATVIGLDSEIIEIEADISFHLPGFVIVGLPDKAVEESKERVRSAIKNSGGGFPETKLTLNLAPADIKKEGPSFDLPIAMAILKEMKEIDFDFEDKIFLGELSLEGKVRKVNGILPIVLMAREKKIKNLFVPKENAREAALIKEINVFPVSSLKELVAHFQGFSQIFPQPKTDLEKFLREEDFLFDMKHIKGQEHAKRALEIAAAGAHNILMTGPPGSGKTLLARTLPSILPKMTFEEILEVTKIYSVAGLLSTERPLITQRPFRNPHHTASGIALVGGGAFPKPGEISLAHRGILFLDEFAEFPKNCLENLRQPLEDGIITISRAQGAISYPAKFSLIASMNPCPCGFFNDPKKECLCTPSQIIKYQKKVSGPLLDRIDLHVEVPRIAFEKLSSEKEEEASIRIREKVQKARSIQEKRFSQKGKTNSEMNPKEIKEFCRVDQKGMNLLKIAVNKFSLSARAYHKILKLSRTIADLEANENIELKHIAEALQYRPK